MKATQEELKMIADYRPTEGVDEGTHIYMSDDEIIDFAKQYHTEQLRLCGVVGRSEQLPILDRCGCEEPNEEPIKVCTNCNGYVE